MARSTFVYVTYIRTTPEKLWSALTDQEFMKQYWFGMHFESQWTAGSSWKLVSTDGQIFGAGEIVKAEGAARRVDALRRAYAKTSRHLSSRRRDCSSSSPLACRAPLSSA